MEDHFPWWWRATPPPSAPSVPLRPKEASSDLCIGTSSLMTLQLIPEASSYGRLHDAIYVQARRPSMNGRAHQTPQSLVAWIRRWRVTLVPEETQARLISWQHLATSSTTIVSAGLYQDVRSRVRQRLNIHTSRSAGG